MPTSAWSSQQAAEAGLTFDLTPADTVMQIFASGVEDWNDSSNRRRLGCIHCRLQRSSGGSMGFLEITMTIDRIISKHVCIPLLLCPSLIPLPLFALTLTPHIYHSFVFLHLTSLPPSLNSLPSHFFLLPPTSPSFTPYFSPFSHCFSPFLTPAGGMRCILCVQTYRARSWHATKKMLEKPFTAPT